MNTPFDEIPPDNSFARNPMNGKKLDYKAFTEYLIDTKVNVDLDLEIAMIRKIPKWVKPPKLKKPRIRSTLLALIKNKFPKT